MTFKLIDVYYEIDGIHQTDDGSPACALKFRNEAVALTEGAIEAAGLGELDGAEIGSREINFGFEVTDFDKAEQLIRDTLVDTKFSNYRAIIRSEWDDDAVLNLAAN